MGLFSKLMRLVKLSLCIDSDEEANGRVINETRICFLKLSLGGQNNSESIEIEYRRYNST
jgi:hypothetical protein